MLSSGCKKTSTKGGPALGYFITCYQILLLLSLAACSFTGEWISYSLPKIGPAYICFLVEDM